VGGTLVLCLLLMGAPTSAQSALLDALKTRVTVAHAAGLPDEVTTERIIQSGDTVATDGFGRAILTYPDGSTVLLERNSSLTVEFLETNSHDYVVRMRQTLGRVWYAVARAVTRGGRYEVRSASMTSVIRAGSDSYVVVTPDGETTVVTVSGTVDTSGGGALVSVPAGSSTTVAAAGATPQTVEPATSTAPTASSTLSPNSPLPSPTTAPSASPPSTTVALAVPILRSTPRPIAAPVPVWTPLKDGIAPRRDPSGQPSARPKLL
jgi:hypothetical protein